MPIKRNPKLVSNEQLQEFFDLFESMTTVVQGGISFPSFRAFNTFEEILPDAFTVKPGLKRSAAIRIFRKALYDCRREGPLTADALIARAEEIYRQNRAVRLKEFTLWTKIRIHGMDKTQILKFKWGDVSIRLCGQLPKWLRLAPFHNSSIGAVVPDTPARSGYIILSCRERKEDDAVDRMLDALNLLMALMNIYQTRGSWTIMSGNNWRAGQLRMGPFQFVFQDRKFLGENRIWYDPNYNEAAWNAQHPGMDKYLQIVPFNLQQPFVGKSLAYANATGLGHRGAEIELLAAILTPYWKWNGSASGSGSAGVNALGTNAIGSTVGNVAAAGRNAVSATRSAAGNAVGSARGTVANAVSGASGAAAATGNAAGNAQGSLGQLALAGSGDANGAGTFAVSPGMTIADTKGRTIGTVQSVQTTASGMVQSVTVAAGKRVATLPAANFSGSGSVLTSAMTKGQVNSAAKKQAAAS